MRTTIEIDDELLSTLKDLASRQGVTLGQMITMLTRRALPGDASLEVRNGVRVFAPRPVSAKSDLTLVNALRDGT
ncbi:MAG: hypothetical protein JO051_01580 [Acidobacteriaceae bacterium]|nr:hypothetical protein [Acidobacteriaceae bacterium]